MVDSDGASEAESSEDQSECPQLEYILEYVIRNPDFDLPAQSLHDLVALVCEEPSQPTAVPPHLLVAGCRAVFTPAMRDTFFEEAIAALDQLAQLEAIRRRYIGWLQTSPSSSSRSKRFNVEKLDRETTKMYDFAWIALRRWTLINEIHIEPFTPMNCLALINVLFVKSSQHRDSDRERTAAMTVLQKIKLFAQQNPDGSVLDCPHLERYESSVPYAKAYAALSRYLDLAMSVISRIEDVVDPVAPEYRKMGIKRDECVLHRISRHLIATDEHGYNLDDRDPPPPSLPLPRATQTTDETHATRQGNSDYRNSSPEL